MSARSRSNPAGRRPLALLAAALPLLVACRADETSGRLYVAPGGEFAVDVPEMRNPFVKAPSRIDERRLPDGGAEVDFSVLDLGEAWRLGVRGPSAHPTEASPADLCDAELARWLRDAPWPREPRPERPAEPAPQLVLEEAVAFAELGALARVYHVEAAALIHRQRDGRPRAALIDVAVARDETGRVLFAVAQFDMPMDQWDFFVEDVGLRPERVLAMMATDDLGALRSRVATLRLGGAR